MFAGIVSTGIVKEVKIYDDLYKICIIPNQPVKDLSLGDSYAINGVCLTAVEGSKSDSLRFDVVRSTLSITALKTICLGQTVNFESAVKFGDPIGGHLLSGHVDCVAKVKSIEHIGDAEFLQMYVIFELDSENARYLIPRGYIAVDGASLTIQDVTSNTFSINLIPHTILETHFSGLVRNSLVNIEFDQQSKIWTTLFSRFETRLVALIDKGNA